MTDFSFDNRIAQMYNRQRAHPDAVARAIGRTLAEIAGPDALLLEMGVGTGRIALPVAAAGCRVVGFDISPNMLAEIGPDQDATGGLHLLRADMHRMPFSRDRFDGVLAVHVLHLSRDLPQVVAEAARVLRPGGAFIQGRDWVDPASVVGQLRDELRRLALHYAPDLLPPAAGVPLAQQLAHRGGHTVNEHQAAEWTTTLSPAERLAMVEQRIDAESWIIPDHLFGAVCDDLRAFAARTWPDLDAPQTVTRRFLLTVTRGEW